MNKKVISWVMYDWANSVFFTTVMAGFFPIFFKKYWSVDTPVVLSTERLGWILAASGFTLAILSPLLGVISDFRRSKKKLLFSFMLCGSFCTVGLYFVPHGEWLSAALLYGFGLFFCQASCVFYDSLLVSVTTPEKYDSVSTLGYSFGYLGGALLFLVNVLMFQQPQMFGLSEGTTGVRVSFLIVGLWWFIFTIPLMMNVPEPEVQAKSSDSLFKLVQKAVRELNRTLKELTLQKNIFYFIVAYWFYIDGVSTVMSMAVDFGISIGFEAGDLIKALLLTQFIGFPASYFAGKLSSRFGNKSIIMMCLAIYAVVVIGASQMTESWHFLVLAGTIGLAQGGVQALSRSLFASLIPQEKAGEYFGFFNLLGKFASVIGPILMATSARVVETPQHTILSLLVLFAFGMYFLSKVKTERVLNS